MSRPWRSQNFHNLPFVNRRDFYPKFSQNTLSIRSRRLSGVDDENIDGCFDRFEL